VTSSLTETTEHWGVALEGRETLMLTIDNRVTLHLHGVETYEGSIILETPFTVRAANTDPVIVEPEDKSSLLPVLACFGKAVEAISVSRLDGALRVTFGDGTVLDARADPNYEAWEVNAPGVKIVSSPGGGEPTLFEQ